VPHESLKNDDLIKGDIRKILKFFATTEDEQVYTMLLKAGRKAWVLDPHEHEHGFRWIWDAWHLPLPSSTDG